MCSDSHRRWCPSGALQFLTGAVVLLASKSPLPSCIVGAVASDPCCWCFHGCGEDDATDQFFSSPTLDCTLRRRDLPAARNRSRFCRICVRHRPCRPALAVRRKNLVSWAAERTAALAVPWSFVCGTLRSWDDPCE